MTPVATDVAAKLASLIGPEHVFQDPSSLAPYQRATFPTSTRPLVMVKPDSAAQVQKILAYASDAGLTVYPISRGCNWGLGSRVPLGDKSLVIDLSRMNKIRAFSREHACIEIEAGVTFEQVASFLRQSESGLYLSVIGGHPLSSVVANTLERGDGLGPLGDRSHHVCSLEVVLADGSTMTTGLSNFIDSALSACTRDPLGPALDGLFFQSNLGIVTSMTVWLKPLASEFASGMITFASTGKLEAALPAIRQLQEQGVIQGNSIAIWNIFKILAANGQHPAIAGSDRAITLDENNLAKHLPKGLQQTRWMVMIALYAPSSSHMRAHRKLVRKLLKPHARRVFLIGKRLARLGKLLAKPASMVFGIELNRWLDALYYQSAYQGNPTELSVRSLYWRKQGEIPATIDPDADRCGLLWLCHLIPNVPGALARSNQIVTDLCRESGFEPNLAYLNTSERCFRMFFALMYDRDVSGDDERAMQCQAQIQEQLIAAGYPPFRLGIQNMDSIKPNDERYRKMIQQLKHLLDPRNTIAPGRYDFS